MLVETGRIVGVDDRSLWIETSMKTVCGSCAAKQSCGQGFLGRKLEGNSYLKVSLGDRDPSLFSIGDSLKIGVDEQVVVRGSLLIYILPLIALIIGATLGQSWFNEAGAILLGVIFMLTSGMAVKFVSQRLEADADFSPVIIDQDERIIHTLSQ